MKRFLMLLLTGSLCLTMMACGGNRSSLDASAEDGVEESGSLESNEIQTEEESEEATETDSDESGQSSQQGDEEETESKEESSEAVSAGSYLDDLYEFKVSIGKISYRIPITYNVMIARGWTYEGDETVTLKPSQYTSQELIERGDVILSASFFNVGINTEEIKDALIGQLVFDRLNLLGCETEILFPGNIVYGESTKEEIVFAYGDPDRTEEADGKEQLIYEKGEYQHITFTIDQTSGQICDVEMMNFEEPENFPGGQISKDVPQEVTDYTAPETLGEDLSKPYVSIEDNLYELPAPVCAFLDNGWSIVEEGSHEAVVAKGAGTVTLEKDGTRITSDVINYADTAVYVENCFVTTVYVDLEENENGMMSIPNGICIHMPSSELETILKGVRYTETNDGRFVYYTISHRGGEENGFIIRLNQQTSQVDSIVCKRMPEQY